MNCAIPTDEIIKFAKIVNEDPKAVANQLESLPKGLKTESMEVNYLRSMNYQRPEVVFTSSATNEADKLISIPEESTLYVKSKEGAYLPIRSELSRFLNKQGEVTTRKPVKLEQLITDADTLIKEIVARVNNAKLANKKVHIALYNTDNIKLDNEFKVKLASELRKAKAGYNSALDVYVHFNNVNQEGILEAFIAAGYNTTAIAMNSGVVKGKSIIANPFTELKSLFAYKKTQVFNPAEIVEDKNAILILPISNQGFSSKIYGDASPTVVNDDVLSFREDNDTADYLYIDDKLHVVTGSGKKVVRNREKLTEIQNNVIQGIKELLSNDKFKDKKFYIDFDNAPFSAPYVRKLKALEAEYPDRVITQEIYNNDSIGIAEKDSLRTATLKKDIVPLQESEIKGKKVLAPAKLKEYTDAIMFSLKAAVKGMRRDLFLTDNEKLVDRFSKEEGLLYNLVDVDNGFSWLMLNNYLDVNKFFNEYSKAIVKSRTETEKLLTGIKDNLTKDTYTQEDADKLKTILDKFKTFEGQKIVFPSAYFNLGIPERLKNINTNNISSIIKEITKVLEDRIVFADKFFEYRNELYDNSFKALSKITNLSYTTKDNVINKDEGINTEEEEEDAITQGEDLETVKIASFEKDESHTLRNTNKLVRTLISDLVSIDPTIQVTPINSLGQLNIIDPTRAYRVLLDVNRGVKNPDAVIENLKKYAHIHPWMNVLLDRLNIYEENIQQFPNIKYAKDRLKNALYKALQGSPRSYVTYKVNQDPELGKTEKLVELDRTSGDRIFNDFTSYRLSGKAKSNKLYYNSNGDFVVTKELDADIKKKRAEVANILLQLNNNKPTVNEVRELEKAVTKIASEVYANMGMYSFTSSTIQNYFEANRHSVEKLKSLTSNLDNLLKSLYGGDTNKAIKGTIVLLGEYDPEAVRLTITSGEVSKSVYNKNSSLWEQASVLNGDANKSVGELIKYLEDNFLKYEQFYNNFKDSFIDAPVVQGTIFDTEFSNYILDNIYSNLKKLEAEFGSNFMVSKGMLGFNALEVIENDDMPSYGNWTTLQHLEYLDKAYTKSNEIYSVNRNIDSYSHAISSLGEEKNGIISIKLFNTDGLLEEHSIKKSEVTAGGTFSSNRSNSGKTEQMVIPVYNGETGTLIALNRLALGVIKEFNRIYDVTAENRKGKGVNDAVMKKRGTKFVNFPQLNDYTVDGVSLLEALFELRNNPERNTLENYMSIVMPAIFNVTSEAYIKDSTNMFNSTDEASFITPYLKQSPLIKLAESGNTLEKMKKAFNYPEELTMENAYKMVTGIVEHAGEDNALFKVAARIKSLYDTIIEDYNLRNENGEVNFDSISELIKTTNEKLNNLGGDYFLRESALSFFLNEGNENTIRESFLTDIWDNTHFNKYVNQKMMNLALNEIFLLDPAQVKSSAEFNKRTKMFSSPRESVNPDTMPYHSERSITIADYESISINYDELEKMYDAMTNITNLDRDVIKASLRDINFSDGQSIRSLKSYRDIMLSEGGDSWTPNMEAIYNKLQDGIKEGKRPKLNKKEFFTFLLAIKPFTAGYISTKINGNEYRTAVQHKNSENVFLTLLPFLELANEYTNTTSYKRIAALAEVLNKPYTKEGGKDIYLDAIHFSSAVKVGARNTYSNYWGDLSYNDNMSVNEIADTIIKKMVDPNDNTLAVNETPWENYGRQVSTPQHLLDTQINLGTQFIKIMFSDLGDINSDEKLFKVGQGEYTPEEIVNLGIQLNGRFLQLGEEKLKQTLLNPDEEKAREYLYEMLEEEIANNPDDYREAFKQLVAERKPLYISKVDEKLSQTLMSKIRKTILKKSMTGGTAILAAPVGVENLKIKYKENEFGVEDPTLGIEYIPMMIPVHNSNLMYKYANEEGYLTEAEIKRIEEDLGEDALRAIGYRVPTESKYSTAPIKIVGFTPAYMGSISVMPAEYTQWAGWDYDIDKLYLIFKTISKDKNGLYINNGIDKETGTEIPVIEITSKAALQNRMFDYMWGVLTAPHMSRHLFDRGGFSELKEEAGKVLYRAAHSLVGTNINTAIENFTKDVEEFGVYLHSKDAILNMLKEQEASLYFDAVEQFLADLSVAEGVDNKSNYNRLLKKYRESAINDDLLSPYNSVITRELSMSGLALTGIAANAVSFSHMTQNMGDVKLPSNINIDGEERLSLTSQHSDTEGKQYISKGIANYLAAAVDNDKDPVLTLLGIDTNTINIAILLTKAGYSLENVALIMKNPFMKIYKDASIEGGAKYAKELLEKYRKSILDKISEVDDKPITTEYLRKSILDNVNPDERGLPLTTEDDELLGNHVKMITSILELHKYADNLSKSSVYSKTDKSDNGSVGKNYEEVINWRLRREEFKSIFPFISEGTDNLSDDIIDDPSKFLKKTIEGKSMVRKYINENNEEFNPFIQIHYNLLNRNVDGVFEKMTLVNNPFVWNIIKEFSSIIGSKTLSTEAIKGITSGFRKYLLATRTSLGDLNTNSSYLEQSRGLLYGLPERFTKLMKTDDAKLLRVNNEFIKRLSITKEKEDNRDIPSLSISNYKNLTNDALDNITKSWEELLNHPNPEIRLFAIDAAKYSLYRDMEDNTSFSNLIPIRVLSLMENYFNEMEDIHNFLTKTEDTSVIREISNDFLVQYISNNINIFDKGIREANIAEVIKKENGVEYYRLLKGDKLLTKSPMYSIRDNSGIIQFIYVATTSSHEGYGDYIKVGVTNDTTAYGRGRNNNLGSMISFQKKLLSEINDENLENIC